MHGNLYQGTEWIKVEIAQVLNVGRFLLLALQVKRIKYQWWTVRNLIRYQRVRDSELNNNNLRGFFAKAELRLRLYSASKRHKDSSQGLKKH